MTSIGTSGDFDLDDDGILRDTLSRSSLIIDDDGIIQGDDLDMYQQVVQGHWTDSGIGGGGGGGMQSITSTFHLQTMDHEEDLTPVHDESVNISELEASKEDINFSRPVEKYDVISPKDKDKFLEFLDSRESTLEKPHNYRTELSVRNDQKDIFGHYSEDLSTRQLFTDDYYKQLHDLGILIDGVDLSRDSINEFDETESQMASRIHGEDDGKVRDSRDLIAEYLESQLRKEEEENSQKAKVSEKGSDYRQNSVAYTHASSQDISSFLDDDDDNVNISENIEADGNPEAQDLSKEKEDASGHVFPGFSENTAKWDKLQQSEKSSVKSRVNLPVGQTVKPENIKIENQAGISYTRSVQQGLTEDDAGYVSPNIFSAGSPPLARTNHMSLAQETVSARRKNVGEITTTQSIIANSQESFTHEKQRTTQTMEKPHQRRLLPKPSNSEPIQSPRVKNLHPDKNGNRQQPVKLHQESVSKALGQPRVNHGSNDTSEETDQPVYVDEATRELHDRLTRESQKCKQATEMVQQLQKDYGNLLSKHALAELTIDQLRFVKQITVHTNSPTPSQAQSGVVSPLFSHQTQTISLQKSPSHGVLLTSPAHGMMGHAATMTDGADQPDKDSLFVPESQRSRSRLDVRWGSVVSLLQSAAADGDVVEKVSGTRVEAIRSDLFLDTRNLDERLESFCSLLDGGHLTLDSQEHMFEQIKSDHDILRRAYIQVKDEYSVLQRSGTLVLEHQNFDETKELEGLLFKVGMRFDEVSDRVENNLKVRSEPRRPFEENHSRPEDNRTGVHNSNHFVAGQQGNGDLTNELTSPTGNKTGIVDTTDTWKLEQRVHQLRDEYNTNMDAYRKLKYSTTTPEGVREIEHIVMKLNDICTEMPDMFRLSPEIQARRDQMERENRLKINDRKNTVWEKLNKREQEVKQHRMSPLSPLVRDNHSRDSYSQMDERAPKILRQGSHNSDQQDSLRARLDGGSSRSSLNSLLPDRLDRLPSRSNSMTDQLHLSHGNRDRPSSRGSNRGYSSPDSDRALSRSGTPRGDHSFSDRGHDSSNTSFRRPRRHEHGMKDPSLPQMPYLGSLRNLTDSMTSGKGHPHAAASPGSHHQGSRVTGIGGATVIHDNHNDLEGALAALPGPGKLKQLTKQRATDDADSGFIGSMVGSGVGLDPAQLQHQQQLQQQQQQHQQQLQQQQQQQLTLRLTKAAEESSTITDQSLDTSSQHNELPQSWGRAARDKTGEKLTNEQENSPQIQGELTYDEEESAEHGISLVTEKSVKGQSEKEMKGKEEKSKESCDASQEDSYSAASDVSTPRATDQSHSETFDTEPAGSSQAPSGLVFTNQPPSRPQKSARGGHWVSKTADILDTTDIPRAKNKKSVTSQDVGREQETVQGSQRSLIYADRPPSRGSPTTDLYHSRAERLNNGGRQGIQLEAEPSRLSKQDQRRNRGRFRESQELPTGEQNRSQQRKHSNMSSDLSGGLSPKSQHSQVTRHVKEYEERSAGSDVEVLSNVTRSSSVASSNRLKALQEEIERLKEGVARANERANQPPPPAQIYHMPAAAPAATSAQQQQQPQPEYYDPFDDPYGFMRMPRRRANSFSGGREREWDEWYWTLPQNRGYDGGDIPLGYAAADAYADLPASSNQQPRTSQDRFKSRLRQRHIAEQQRPGQSGENERETTPGQFTGSQQPHSTANQPGTRSANEHRAALHEYYLPSRFHVPSTRQQMTPHGAFRSPETAKMYSSTGEDGDNEDEHDIVADSGYPGRTNNTNNQPWYHIRRMPGHFAVRGTFLQTGRNVLSQSHDNIRHLGQIGQHFHPRPRPQMSPAAGVGYRTATQVCPMCGGTGSHSHTDYVGQSNTTGHPTPQHTNLRDSSPSRTGRQKSRSPAYTGARRSHSQSRYRVREYSHCSDSEEDERVNVRSRSLSRGRSRKRLNDRNPGRRHRQRSHSASDQSGDEETDLDYSLSLSADIGRITKKIMGTVSGELLRLKEKREFGSSFW